MGCGKKPDGASVDDLLWPDDDERTETDWNSIFRYLMDQPPLGRGMSFEQIGRLTFEQLKFLVQPEKKKDTKKDIQRRACVAFMKMMRRTGWSARRLAELPTTTLLQHYMIDSGIEHPGKTVVEIQLRTFLKQLSERSVPKNAKVKVLTYLAHQKNA